MAEKRPVTPPRGDGPDGVDEGTPKRAATGFNVTLIGSVNDRRTFIVLSANGKELQCDGDAVDVRLEGLTVREALKKVIPSWGEYLWQKLSILQNASPVNGLSEIDLDSPLSDWSNYSVGGEYTWRLKVSKAPRTRKNASRATAESNPQSSESTYQFNLKALKKSLSGKAPFRGHVFEAIGRGVVVDGVSFGPFLQEGTLQQNNVVPAVAVSDEAILAVFQAFKEAESHLRAFVNDQHIQIWEPFSVAQRERFLSEFALYELLPYDPTFTRPFYIDPIGHKWNIGKSLLGPLHSLIGDRALFERFVYLFMLHEMLHHIEQKITSATYSGIGRADVVLEDLDYSADAFAIIVSTSILLRRDRSSPSETARGLLHAAIRGIEIFDRVEQGGELQILPERRLRRYLIWNLQHEVVALATSLEQVSAILKRRLSIQIAPLQSSFQGRLETEKTIFPGAGIEIVEAKAELFVAVGAGGRLFRYHRGNNVALIIRSVAQFKWIDVRRFLVPVAQDIADYIRECYPEVKK